MKRKQFSLLMIGFTSAVILLAVWFEIFYLPTSDVDSGIDKMRPLSEIEVPDKAVLEKMDRLERQMHLLSVPPPSMRRKADLSAMGYRPMTRTMAGDHGDASLNASTHIRF